jgi:Pyruvate/2-oxoacid:ferredoxin oxidoreductase delta subunit
MLSDDGVLFDYRFCKGCGVCSNECPFGAISMVRE